MMMLSKVRTSAIQRILSKHALVASKQQRQYPSVLLRNATTMAATRTDAMGNTSSTTGWIPPEARNAALTATKQYHDHQQQRDFVWHAGFMEQEQVQELEKNIHTHMSQMMEMIQRLASTTHSITSAATATDDNRLWVVEQILQHEHMILQLCQEYKQLTGEDYEALPKPDCDESATVIRMT
mmetsp:Transcript_13729/g.23832  ORF Transcript_13729/g.23832 Transcript_13729/m.23832 type:complete len:182 (-) Transcript_13729:457-1002(-)